MAEIDHSSNTKKAISFLKSFRTEGYINLIAIDPNSGNISGITRPIRHDDLTTFIQRHNGKRNVYFMVNEPKPGSPDNKLKKSHVDKIHAVWIDADPNKDKPFDDERVRLTLFAEELKQSDNPPTYIIDSGGGFQAFWVLNEPVEMNNMQAAEAYSRGLAQQYDTDMVQNIDRIMRIPYTLNIPTPKKVKAGRSLAPAKVYYAESQTGTRYDYTALDTFIIPAEVAETTHVEFTDTELDMTLARKPLSDEMKKKLTRTCKRNKKIADVWQGKTAQFKPSKSELDMTLTKELKSEGYTLQETGNVLLNFKHGGAFNKQEHKQRREIVRTYNNATVDVFTDLPDDYIVQIENQTNPITQAKEEKAEIKKNRRGLIHASEATYKTSGIPLIKGLFDQQSVVLLYGPPNSGKSFATLDIGMSIAAGNKMWDKFKIKQQMGVLVVCGEAGQSYGKRVEATRNRFGFDHNTTYNELPFAHIDNYYDFMDDKDHLKELEEAVLDLEKRSGHKCGLVIIDTLSSTFGSGSENAAEDARKYLNNLRAIAHKLKFTLLIVHHTGKDIQSGARGSSVFLGDVDTQLSVNAVKKGEKWERTLISTKQREAEKDKTTRFGLNIVELAKDEDGDPITTCTIVLEDDDLFEDVTPSLTEGLSVSDKSLLKAVNFYTSNKINSDHYKFTKMQLMILLYNDIKCKNNVLVYTDENGNEVFDPLQFSVMASPNSTLRRSFTRDKKKFLQVSNPDIDAEITEFLEILS